MSGGGAYDEVALHNNRALPRDVKEALNKLSSALAPSNRGAHSATDARLGPRSIESSPLRVWAEASHEMTSGNGRKMKPFTDKAAAFSIFPVIDEIRDALMSTDVVVLIAPTGAGKSLLAPYLAEELAWQTGRVKEEGKAHRKTMLVAPSVEHCGGTARAFDKLFRHTDLSVSAFFNPYEEHECTGDGVQPSKRNQSKAEFVYCPYSAALRVLPNAKLNLLILDEVHEPNDNVQVAIGMARKNMHKTLKKLLLMTATLDEKERKRYEEYFTSADLSFKILDYSAKLKRKFDVTMSCLDGPFMPHSFQKTAYSQQVSRELSREGLGSVQSRCMDTDDEFHRLKVALNVAMEFSWLNLHERMIGGVDRKHCHMRSIIVILPGLEQVERLYSASYNLSNFKSARFEGKLGFHPVRLTSLVRDDDSITTECPNKGSWGGRLGRIVFTTNLITAGLTVPNAAFIIDCGRQKILDDYTKDGLRSLTTIDVDRLMIVQRAGRTGRTIDGEYFLPYSAEEVDEMMQLNHGDLLLNRNFDERHFLYKKLYKLKLLHKPPESLLKELKKSMEIRGLYTGAGGFPPDVLLMHSLLNFLSTEQARIIIQGVRLGIAAHVIHLVADAISRVRFTRAGAHCRSAIHQYCEAMDEKLAGTLPESYEGVGDSIALADLLASFYRVFPRHAHRKELEALCSSKRKDKKGPKDNNFWSGSGGAIDGERTPFKQLYDDYIREEGRDAVSRYVSQIEAALKGARILPRDCSIFDPRLNRHVVSRDNFCLDADGRALLVALFTMHSSRVGQLCHPTRKNESPVYEIYRASVASKKEFLTPDSAYSQPKLRLDPIYGRYSEMFKRRDKYTNLIDPITLKQLAFFLNVNGGIDVRKPEGCASVTLKLNASTAAKGIKIMMDATTTDNVSRARKTLTACLEALTNNTNQSQIADLEQFIIELWRECEKTEEDQPPPYYSLGFTPRGAFRSRALPSFEEINRAAWDASTASGSALTTGDEGGTSDSEKDQWPTSDPGW